MQSIPIVLAAADMVLAREVRRPDNPSGPPICGSGIVLTDSLLDRLKTLGIQTLTVEGHPVTMQDEKGLDELLQELDRRFCKVADDPLMAKLKNIYRKRLLESWGDDGR
jgi:hypothetical protein